MKYTVGIVHLLSVLGIGSSFNHHPHLFRDLATVCHAVLFTILHGSNRESCAVKAKKTLPLWRVCWVRKRGLRGVQQLQGQEEVWGPWQEETSMQCKEVYPDHEGYTSA